MSQRRVVITGLGIVSPVGNDVPTAWDAIVNGRSGIGRVTSFDATGFATQIAGEVRNFDPTAWIPPKDAKKMDEFIHYGVAASFMALEEEFECEIPDEDAEKITSVQQAIDYVKAHVKA